MPKTGMRELRRAQLIDATLLTIDEAGLAGTTLALVARRAKISTGIVSHYFGDKDGLLEATMRHVLRALWAATARRRKAAKPQPRARLRAIVAANFDASQISGPVMKTWLAFWSQSMHAPALRRLQRVNTRRLYSNLCAEFAKALPRARARRAAHGLAAMIDGLWLRGALSGVSFQGASHQGASHQGASFQGASLRGMSPQGASLRGMSPQGASLRGTSPQGASLRGMSLQGASHQRALPQRVPLRGEPLWDESFSGESFSGKSFSDEPLSGNSPGSALATSTMPDTRLALRLANEYIDLLLADAR